MQDTISDQQKRGSTSRHKLDKCISAPERNKLEKQDQIDETLRLFVGDLNVRGSRVTLPVVGSNLNPSECESFKPARPAKPSLQEKHREESLDDVFEEPAPAIPPRAPVAASAAIATSVTEKKEPPKATKRPTGEPEIQPSKLEERPSVNSRKMIQDPSVTKPQPRGAENATPPIPLPRKIEEPSVAHPHRKLDEVPPPLLPRKVEECPAPALVQVKEIPVDQSVVKTEEAHALVPPPRKTDEVPVGPVPRKSQEPGFFSFSRHSDEPLKRQHSVDSSGLTSHKYSYDYLHKEPSSASHRRLLEDSSAPSSPTKSKPEDTRRKIIPSKPQSLTNLSTVGTESINGAIYTGFLHQRQPHWKFGGPRWSRCRATVDTQVFRLLKPELEIQISSAFVTLASEVHSRPFAFKIEDKKGNKVYLYIFGFMFELPCCGHDSHITSIVQINLLCTTSLPSRRLN